jgi:ATP adenylyltransferase
MSDYKHTKDCPFCYLDEKRELIVKSKLAYAIYDQFPVSDGHALIVSVRHCADYFELSEEEQTACWALVNDVKQIIQGKYSPDGFNVGININEAAGQTISHVHIHLIPRYNGDIKDPEGGIRSVIPNKKTYRNK